MAGKVVELPGMPGTLDIYARAVRSALPVVGASGDSAPDTTLTLSGVKVDPDNLAAYDRVTGLRFGDTLPLTYPFTLVFPIVMKLMVSDGFPFPAIGSVHAENVIEQFRPISVSEPLDVSVHAENLREHRKGLLIDVVSEIRVGRELVWRQTSSFLRQQKTSLSGQPGPEPKPEEVPPPPLRTLRVDQKTISKYAGVSGDRNPIHVSTLGAKAFGFPKTIAHGMWSAAAVLGSVEGRIPEAVTYSVRFGKPILLPATLNVYADHAGEGWELSLKHPKKGYPHLTATLR
ncbi:MULTISPECIES: MaoC/PaaZ C-terminal domain-containing protein [Rhodococcus]|jgi:acyl dehydratase|uniref:MaoC/PaaZ C-terminal domain-containing protein n=1 Tax=Rhodococcus oxybenzonivorans TaxID=1990687 RepID=A0AAE4UYI5_9NOCA|nr:MULTISPECIES: MaoC/PaaZ C-terminal domain-containing protein [Rhodococcus]MDV7246421.1 MaoC/PaaZ C-terminal domain-containing protein [Rhodococcus oxybenzonivorans]MDV7265120.1 MaoC/PaaZ C-terminal domain-containing protein [Rhodococcus oxybenzonivorans]MDV7277990.1 MaoC/PaaZ C-terminal domain-containing protein [Rhodococcus oxybenzonivorans]MDV7337433.1 MaoC/PaaZ C-terminal domain-containing protein [Rhodococcus oxybenzonivorans]MDV7347538.1 MaoC/PaaZ C-terminal domain-containing protein [